MAFGLHRTTLLREEMRGESKVKEG
jgi:hypothetical protein